MTILAALIRCSQHSVYFVTRCPQCHPERPPILPSDDRDDQRRTPTEDR